MGTESFLSDRAVLSEYLPPVRLEFPIVFHDMTETPAEPAPGRGCSYSALIFNQCDGYHHVFARFDSDDGEFLGFFDFCGSDAYEPDRDYCAWALLPDTRMLDGFARKGPWVEPVEGRKQRQSEPK